MTLSDALNPALPANLRGALWVLLAGLLFAGMGTVVKLVGGTLEAPQIVFFRNFFGLLLLAPFLAQRGLGLWRTDRPGLQIARALVGLAAMSCMFYALTRLPLADVVAAGFAKTFFILILAAMVLGEKVGWRRWTATAVGFGGVVLMMRPLSGGLDGALLIALLGAALIAVAVTLVKKLSARDGPITILAWFGLVASLASLPGAVAVWQPVDWPTLGWLAATGVLGIGAQGSLIAGYRCAEASAIAPMGYLQLVFAGLLGFLVFGEVPDAWTLAGAALIVATTLYIARREAVLGRRGPAEPPTPS